MVALSGCLQFPHGLGLCNNQGSKRQKMNLTRKGRLHILGAGLSSRVAFCQHDQWSFRLSKNVCRPIHHVPYGYNAVRCHSFRLPYQAVGISGAKSAGAALMRSYNALQSSPLVLKVVCAASIIAFAIWGLEPLMKKSRNLFLHRNDGNWKKSRTYYVTTSFLQPLLLWSGVILICRAMDPVILPIDDGEIVKQQVLNFVRSLSTVLVFAYCLSSVIEQLQKFFMETSDPSDTRNIGFQFAGRAVWVAAVLLFMELLGFSTQKWLTAGGLGTVLLTLAGREIFTNFLSSVMIHATRPFIVNEWIQTKIEGYDVSGTVEHVGWWSSTVIRGEDREAVHIPNHKFTVNVVRNLSKKTHWRIKTHLAISHLDVNKINNIVADMRKVLAKNPQVEQQKLHRRVFLDYIHPENQALLILVSCFVKTSHFEEYLCVKEAILLDLLRVISHHRARLATPIRRVQKVYGDTDLDNTPFTDSSFSRGGMTSHRPLMLIEPSYEIKEDKNRTRTGRTSADQDGKVAAKPASETEVDTKVAATSLSDSKVKDGLATETKVDANNEAVNHDKEELEPGAGEKRTTKSSPKAVSLTNNKVSEKVSSDSKVSVPDSVSSAQKTSDNKQRNKSSLANGLQGSKNSNSPASSMEAVSNNSSGGSTAASEAKPESEKLVAGHPSVSRSSIEENIVLGVALEGSKRTLPIDEGMDLPSSSAEAKELATLGHGAPTAESDKKDGQNKGNPGKSGDK